MVWYEDYLIHNWFYDSEAQPQTRTYIEHLRKKLKVEKKDGYA